MLKLIQSFIKHSAQWLALPSEPLPVEQAWPEDLRYRADPLSHPALRAMDQRQLGDLPFNPRCFDADHQA